MPINISSKDNEKVKYTKSLLKSNVIPNSVIK